MIEGDRVDLPKDQPVGQLPPQPWISDPSTRRLVAALTVDGAEMRFVGGCVRDALLGRPVKDIDIAITAHPDQVMALLEKAGLKALPTGIEHGTVTALVDGRRFEITSLRIDIETDGRRAKVAFTGGDWMADARRRDFTMNALYCRPDGAIIDPCDGLPDLGAGRVRFVGNAMARIEEDALRILRFFRFYAEYGSPPADREALFACRMGAPLLKALSGERIAAEMMKLLDAPDPASIVLLMRGEGVLREILPEAALFGRLRLLTFVETRGVRRPDIAPDPLRRLASLLPGSDAAEPVASRFRLSNADRVRLIALTAPEPQPFAGMGVAAARRMLYTLGPDLFRDRLLLAWAGLLAETGHGGAGSSNDWTALLDQALAWQAKPLPVSGRDLIALGVAEGPGLGRLLDRLQHWWIENDFQGDRRQALDQARHLIDTGKAGGNEQE